MLPTYYITYYCPTMKKSYCISNALIRFKKNQNYANIVIGCQCGQVHELPLPLTADSDL